MVLVETLRDFADEQPTSPSGDVTAGVMQAAAAEIERLHAIIDSPENDDFIRGVSIEAEHQIQRWGEDHDANKNGWDWFWIVGFLIQKACAAFEAGDFDKAKHHCISTAALMKNMHAVVEKHERAAEDQTEVLGRSSEQGLARIPPAGAGAGTHPPALIREPRDG